jgi:hypothetical protein
MDFFLPNHISSDIYKVTHQYSFTKNAGDNYMIYSLIIIIIARILVIVRYELSKT